MSLVNQMLRDLDARRAGEAERGALPAAVTALDDAGGGSRRGVVLAAAALIAAVAGAAAYFLDLSPGRNALPAAAPVARPPATMPAPVPAAPATVSPAPTFTPATEAAAPPVTAAPAVDVPAVPEIDAKALRLDADLARPPATPKPPATSGMAPSAVKAAKPRPVEAHPATTPPVAVAATVASPAAPAASPAEESRIDKQLRQPTPAERADAEFRRGQLAQRQGAVDDAMARYRAALAEQPEHAASRQALVLLLIERRRYDDAEEALGRGLALFPRQAWWPMTLARLKVERGEATAALDILQRQAAAGEASSDYQGFHGALLQRAARPGEAVERYAAATRLAPAEARWWAGLGIALESAGRVAEARQAFERARSLPGLPADLAAHVEQRLR